MGIGIGTRFSLYNLLSWTENEIQFDLHFCVMVRQLIHLIMSLKKALKNCAFDHNLQGHPLSTYLQYPKIEKNFRR